MPFEPGKSGNPATQFKPGESGNPAGKPKGTKSLSTLIRELENEDFDWELVPIKVKDQAKKIGSPWKAIVFTAMAKAYSGDVKAMEWLRKAGYGDKLNVEVEGGLFSENKLVIEVVKPKALDEDEKNTTERETEAGA
jgi:hypothetical protein